MTAVTLSVQVELKEMELAHQEAVKTLKMEHDQQITRAREDFERLASGEHAA